MIRRVFLLATAAGALAVASAAPVLAHIDPVPSEAQAGSTLSVAFTVEHGCDGSPTVQLDMRLPEGVTNAAPEPLDGWETSIDGNVVTFAGGMLADDVEGTFAVTMTLPPTPDETIYFPFVQRCEVGEIRWIAVPVEPGDELDEPAPAMVLTGPVVTPTSSTPASGSTATSEPAATTPTVSSTPDSVAPAATVEASAATTDPTVISPATVTDDSSGSNTGTIAFVITVLVMLGLGVLVWFRARAARAAA